jgi:dihydroorotate dehydrogenase (NAD+) catalytic subunit
MTRANEGVETGTGMELRVELNRLALANPILLASGTAGYIRELEGYLPLSRLGGVIPKTVTAMPREGNPTPRTAETAAGMLNSIGLDNDGVEHFLSHHLPYLRGLGTAVIANVAGETKEQFVELAERVGEAEGVTAVELNLSCPNVSRGLDLGVDAGTVERVVARCVQRCRVPVVAKLTPNVTDLCAIARGARDGGADAVSLVNTVRGMAIDWRRARPILAATYGGLSGPAIKPIALRAVHEVARALPDLPIIGIGGITTPDDMMEFLVAGATAVQVGTATFFRPGAAGVLLEALPGLLSSIGVRSVRAVVGRVHRREG